MLDVKTPGKHYAEERNPHHSGSWPELHVFDTAEERDEFVAKTRNVRDLTRADKVAMTQRGEKHWFERSRIDEKKAFKYIDKCVERGPSGVARIVVHHKLDPHKLAEMREQSGYMSMTLFESTDSADTAPLQVDVDSDTDISCDTAVNADAQ